MGETPVDGDSLLVFTGDWEPVRCCLEGPMMVRRMLQRLLPSSSRSLSELELELSEVGRRSAEENPLKLDERFNASDCAEEIPSKDRNEEPGVVETSGSVRTMMRHRLGAGLHGKALGSTVPFD